ncbi:MAG: hypothetical protein KAT09_01525 [Candidatus Aegiribacteria sp.]|nr:hypothetical protein [Candidatus Aegiribacteria sp.]
MKIRIEVLLGLLITVSSTGFALDTTEAFDPGFSDLEVYFGYHGLDNSSESSVVSAETLIGIGVTGNFSTYVSYAVESNGYLANTEDCFTMGLFWTAIENETVKLDLFGSTGTGGSIAFGIESNIDFDNWGFQLQIEETLANKNSLEREQFTMLQPLLYYRFSSGVELLSAVDLEYAGNESGEKEFDYSSVSFGVNFPVTESIELISQFDLINTGEEETETGISFGFVAGV